jgi:hypothetical protein
MRDGEVGNEPLRQAAAAAFAVGNYLLRDRGGDRGRDGGARMSQSPEKPWMVTGTFHDMPAGKNVRQRQVDARRAPKAVHKALRLMLRDPDFKWKHIRYFELSVQLLPDGRPRKKHARSAK